MKKLVVSLFLVLLVGITVKAQDKKENKNNLLVKLQKDANPKIYVDGKLFDFPIELIDQSKIATVMVIKKQEALKKYNAPNGVVLITTKKPINVLDPDDLKINKDSKFGGKNGPKVIIDGKIANKKQLDKMTPNMVKSMKIIKGEKALKKYNAPNGVVLITTKKKTN